MSKTDFRRRIGIAVILIGVLPLASLAQLPHWTKCDTSYHTADSGGRFTANISPYFLNEAIGFAYEYMIPKASPRIHPRLFRTKDSARTWEICDTIGIDGGISSLWFTSAAHGYLSGTAIYETFDTGFSWKKISQPGTIDRVLAAGNTLFMAGSFFGNGSYGGRAGVFNNAFQFSTNNGLSWTSPTLVTGVNTYAYGLTGDGENFVAVNYYRSDDTTWWVAATYDAGANWKTYAVPSQYYMVRDGGWLGNHPWCLRSRQTLYCIVEYPARIVRSLDLSAGWDTVLSSDTSFSFDDEFAGAGCTLYVASSALVSPPRTSAIQRSTDLGKSWHIIVAPRYNHIRDGLSEFCAAGTGATIFLFDDSGYIWRTKDGGDGALSSSDRQNISVAHLGATRDTLITQMCDSGSFSITAANSGCLRYWLDSVVIDGIGPNDYYTVLHNRSIGDGQPSDTALVTILSKKSGTYPLIVHARLRREDWASLDTTFHLTLTVKPNAGLLDLTAAPLYDFGVLPVPNAVARVDSFHISAHGCEQVTIDSIIFTPIVGNGFTFTNVASFAAPQGPKPGAVKSRAFPISFLPTQPGFDSGRVVIYSFDGESDRTDTLRLRGLGLMPEMVGENDLSDEAFAVAWLHPNPAQGEITIGLQKNPQVLVNYDVLDALGIVRLHGKTMDASLSLDLSRLPSGTYFVRIVTSEGSVMRKVIRE